MAPGRPSSYSRDCAECGGTGWTWAVLMPQGTLSAPAACAACGGEHRIPVQLPVDVFDLETQQLLEAVGRLGTAVVAQDWLRGTWPRQLCWRMVLTRPSGQRVEHRDPRRLAVICRQIVRLAQPEVEHGRT